LLPHARAGLLFPYFFVSAQALHPCSPHDKADDIKGMSFTFIDWSCKNEKPLSVTPADRREFFVSHRML
jgi:hypothetical protein